jgi:hypothetical protein
LVIMAGGNEDGQCSPRFGDKADSNGTEEAPGLQSVLGRLAGNANTIAAGPSGVNGKGVQAAAGGAGIGGQAAVNGTGASGVIAAGVGPTGPGAGTVAGGGGVVASSGPKILVQALLDTLKKYDPVKHASVWYAPILEVLENSGLFYHLLTILKL